MKRIESKIAVVTGAGQGIDRNATTFKAVIPDRDSVYAAFDHA